MEKEKGITTKILLGGSPCTYWSISQKNNREVEAKGLGWELFKNFLIAKEKFRPDYFLYENNKSAAQAIKDQIKREFNVYDGTMLMQDTGARYIEINSALVSAQHRQRFYVHNVPGVELPDDRGILLKDILESGIVDREKSYCLKHQAGNSRDYFKKRHTQVAFEPTVPIRIGTIESGERSFLSDSQANRVYSPYGKSTTINSGGGGGGGKTGLYACPINDQDGKSRTIKAQYHKSSDVNATYKSTYGATLVCEEFAGQIKRPVYFVKDNTITIKEKKYPINLPDGYYIIRKLTVNECRRLQTIPEWYQMPCSDTQNYKMLGNGWTIEVIKHILKNIPNLRNEPIEVLSMYDGMSCARITLQELGANIVKYKSYEIDKYAIQTTQTNFPDTIQMGDAFAVRQPDWHF